MPIYWDFLFIELKLVFLLRQITEKNKQLSLIKKTQSSEKEKQHQLVNEKLKIEGEIKNQVEQLKVMKYF